MCVLLYLLRVVYIKTSRCLNRIESISRSPVYSHTNSTIQGLSTIRAFKAQKIFNKEYNYHQDKNTAALYLFFATTRAFALWLDLICVTYIAVVTFSFLMIGHENFGGNVGLVITQVILLTGMCQWGIRQTAEVENKMVSAERIVEYTKIQSEPPLETAPKYRPPKGWPEHGSIVFDRLSLRYTPDSDFVLRKINLRINPNVS